MSATNSVVRVPVDIPGNIFWKLAGIAEIHDMKVPELLADLAIASSRLPKAIDTDPIVARWREGMTDKQIAAELVLTNRQVASRRQSYGLPANPKRSTT